MFTSNVMHYQNFIRRKLSEFEKVYFDITYPLVSKLKDLGVVSLPSIVVPEFNFIYEWEEGKASSQEVQKLLSEMNPASVSKIKLTRKFSKFQQSYPQYSDYVLPTIAQIEEKALPIYKQYMCMATQFFNIASKCDEGQMKITWLQTDMHKDGGIVKAIEDLTLNQTIRQLDSYQIPANSEGYFLGKNLLCFDEGENDETGYRKIHWIFAPEAYIKMIRAFNDVYNELDLNNEDFVYIKGLIGEHIK